MYILYLHVLVDTVHELCLFDGMEGHRSLDNLISVQLFSGQNLLVVCPEQQPRLGGEEGGGAGGCGHRGGTLVSLKLTAL